MSSVFHSPACEMTYALVPTQSKGSDPFSLQFGLHISDTSLWVESGIFTASFPIYKDGQLVADPVWAGWTPTQFPKFTDLWMGWFYARALDATGGSGGVFNFRPQIFFIRWGPGGSGISPFPPEFAVAEEDQYFVIDS